MKEKIINVKMELGTCLDLAEYAGETFAIYKKDKCVYKQVGDNQWELSLTGKFVEFHKGKNKLSVSGYVYDTSVNEWVDSDIYTKYANTENCFPLSYFKYYLPIQEWYHFDNYPSYRLLALGEDGLIYELYDFHYETARKVYNQFISDVADNSYDTEKKKKVYLKWCQGLFSKSDNPFCANPNSIKYSDCIASLWQFDKITATPQNFIDLARGERGFIYAKNMDCTRAYLILVYRGYQDWNERFINLTRKLDSNKSFFVDKEDVVHFVNDGVDYTTNLVRKCDEDMNSLHLVKMRNNKVLFVFHGRMSLDGVHWRGGNYYSGISTTAHCTISPTFLPNIALIHPEDHTYYELKASLLPIEPPDVSNALFIDKSYAYEYYFVDTSTIYINILPTNQDFIPFDSSRTMCKPGWYNYSPIVHDRFESHTSFIAKDYDVCAHKVYDNYINVGVMRKSDGQIYTVQFFGYPSTVCYDNGWDNDILEEYGKTHSSYTAQACDGCILLAGNKLHFVDRHNNKFETASIKDDHNYSYIYQHFKCIKCTDSDSIYDFDVYTEEGDVVCRWRFSHDEFDNWSSRPIEMNVKTDFTIENTTEN